MISTASLTGDIAGCRASCSTRPPRRRLDDPPHPRAPRIPPAPVRHTHQWRQHHHLAKRAAKALSGLEPARRGRRPVADRWHTCRCDGQFDAIHRWLCDQQFPVLSHPGFTLNPGVGRPRGLRPGAGFAERSRLPSRKLTRRLRASRSQFVVRTRVRPPTRFQTRMNSST